jgi:hypothetical protein
MRRKREASPFGIRRADQLVVEVDAGPGGLGDDVE